MAADEAHSDLTEAEISEFGRQLYEWTKSLPLVQQGLLHRILARAASAEANDTSGYALGAYAPASLDQLLGLLHEAIGINTLGGPDTKSLLPYIEQDNLRTER
jgi:hypothetical protein